MNSTPRKYEKVDDKTVRIKFEKIDELPVTRLINDRETLIKQKDLLRNEIQKEIKQMEDRIVYIDKTIANITEILNEAKKLGIKVEEKNDSDNNENNEKKK